MQKNSSNYSLQTIYIKKKDIKTLNLAPEKKGLRHYLTVIEKMTRESFFVKGSVPILSKDFKGISKNSFQPIFDLYERTHILKFKKGLFGRISYQYPETHPNSLDEWTNVRGGFLKIDRDLLKTLVEKLSDNELRLYFALMLIDEASYKDTQKEMGIMTWPKVLRESHLNISQKTLKACLDSLEEKKFISTMEPLDLESRLKSRFLFCLNSQKFLATIQENSKETSQNPKTCAHIKENINKLGKTLNQGRAVAKKILPQKKKNSDFNFWGLENLKDPLTIGTVNRLINHNGFTKDQVQESVMRFSRYYFSDEEIQKEYANPVGFLYSHMKQFNQIFIEPEWWLELQHRVDLGEDRFKHKSKEAAVNAERVDSQAIEDFFGDIMNILNNEGVEIVKTFA